MEPSVWLLDLAQLPLSAEALEKHFLTSEEHARRDRLLRAEDRLRFVAGRALCRCVLAQIAGGKADAIELATDENGRPFVVSGAEGLFFNLSHSGPIVALAVATFQEIGVDTEKERAGVAEALTPKVCANSEQDHLARLDPQARRQRFFELWTLKEAYLKAIGVGVGADPRQCAFELSERPRAVSLPNDAPEAWRFDLWRVAADQSLALCRPFDRGPAEVDPPRRGDDALLSAASSAG